MIQSRYLEVSKLGNFLMLFLILSYSQYSKAESTQQSLIEQIEMKCVEEPSNGLICSYKIGEILEVSIKDVGGQDTVVGIRKSNIQSEFYTVMYFGCIVIVPGLSHPRNYSKDYVVYLSPNAGGLYKTKESCLKTLE